MITRCHICFCNLVSLWNWNAVFVPGLQVEEAEAWMFKLCLKCCCSATSQNVLAQRREKKEKKPRENNKWKKTRCYLRATRGKCACYQLQSLRLGQEMLMVVFTAGATVAYFPPSHHFPFLITSKIQGPRASIGEDKQGGAKRACKKNHQWGFQDSQATATSFQLPGGCSNTSLDMAEGLEDYLWGGCLLNRCFRRLID